MSKSLFPPGDYRDNCGFGLIAHMQGNASHHLLQTAIEALTCMTHRGGIAADGKTGDGCGLLMKLPDGFLREVAREAGGIELGERYGVGMVFLNPDEAKAQAARAEIERALTGEGLEVAGWRDVPTDKSMLGRIALDSLPRFAQVFVNAAGKSAPELELALFMARRMAEQALVQDAETYICSLSSQVLSYKGLMMPADLPRFYPDLGDARLETAICVFHQRFSTNTLPRWPLAQPFRLLAHNGEINTIQGNRNWAMARRKLFSSDKLQGLDRIETLVNRSGSDSSSMDNMLEVLLTGGMDLFRALRLMVPPAWQNVDTLDPALRAFYEFNSMHMEPWDGPAGVVLTEGRHAVCMLDRNGLRPARWVMTKNGYITLSSEIGVYSYQPEDVIAKGRVGPGQLLAVDTETGRVLHTNDIEDRLMAAQPYGRWLRDQAIRIEATLEEESAGLQQLNEQELQVFQKMFMVSYEERDQVIRALAENGQEAVGSMGDDTPMPVLSTQVRSLYDYFRQQFAQVTNPPIDPLRESIVMSLQTCVGPERNVFTETEHHARRVVLNSPVLSPVKFRKLLDLNLDDFQVEQIDLQYSAAEGLGAAIVRICDQAEQAVRSGKTLLVLSDARLQRDTLPVHAAMATGAVHHRLIDEGLRCNANIIVETGTARDSHHFAVLIGYGATAVYPYLAYEVLCDQVRRGDLLLNPVEAAKNYRKGINKGLLKILSKMGISAVSSYRGAQLFEAVGLHDEVVDLCFKDTTSRIQGATFENLQADQQQLAREAWSARKPIRAGGLLKYVHGAEYHAFNPDVVQTLHEAVKSGDYSRYRDYAGLVNQRPVATIRDLFGLRAAPKPIPLDEVEPVEKLFPRFDSAGMSLGALSPEAHEALAMAMNRLGGRSNSGEGGEDPARYGTERTSKIKQVASGRFGVTPHYLVNAEVLQIKVAQGAKPGEGGQLPGGKVNELIARLRYSVPGVTLISPPPHHDIYSIEDLAQLIFDLKQVNPDALVSVKLVSEPGVGTIAAGVAKAYADLITISGYDGGTAASPLTSIRYAGCPWELGLREAHQVLRENELRDKIRLQTDGGLKTGLDVVKAAALGAESFGFGTTPMVALGCKYLRICHLNNCATGVATQNQPLRDDHFIGTVEMVENFFRFVAAETREWMALLGVRTLEELIGRTEYLEILPGRTDKQRNLDLSPILSAGTIPDDKPRFCQSAHNDPFDKGELAERMVQAVLPAIESTSGGEFSFKVTNCDRSIGARISGEIAKRHGNQAMESAPVVLRLKGTAGQSFGVWNAGGLHMYLEGDANDYVGKGMAGGRVVIRPPAGSEFESQETAIIGNTCLYGATGGTLYAAGRAGERFAVRNSGARAVIEGAGDHCCEYMTGGVITVLGATGHNFGAGMTGGFAYVLDLDNSFVDKYNMELVEIARVRHETMEAYRHHLQQVIRVYAHETGSVWGQHLLEHFNDVLSRFWLVKPKAASLQGLMDQVRKRPE